MVILVAIFAYTNKIVLKLPFTIGLMLISSVFSIILIAIDYFIPSMHMGFKQLIEELDFSKIVIDVMLCFLLFAGAMHTDYNQLKKNKRSIILFSFVSVILSTFFIGGVIYYISMLVGIEMNFLYALLFGALISPTDPVAVLGILTKANVPKKAEINIVGESLFNDGIGVVVFISLLSVLNKGIEKVTFTDILLLFAQEALGGLLLGLGIGYLIYILLKSIDDYETEVIITLAAVLGGNWLAHSIHVSGPLAMVVAGLMTGHKSKQEAMSDNTQLYVDKFWHLMDVLLNAILFVLIGLKIMSIHFEWSYFIIAIVAIPFLIFSRYIALVIPFSITKKWLDIDKKTIKLMTWGGLRGGLSIAMALSLSDAIPVKDGLVFLTYIVVFFSIFIQGLTIEKYANKLFK